MIDKKFVMTMIGRILLICAMPTVFCIAAISQTKKNVAPKTPAKIDAKADPDPQPTPQKRNERPEKTKVPDASHNSVAEKPLADPAYFYEFTQPHFVIQKITIKHDEKGNGTLTFSKGEFDEPITEPLALSQTTLEKINAALTALDFLNSSADYQYEKDYSHLGNIAFRFTRDGRSREVHYNYTENKEAKALADEYRRISNQVIWVFDMSLARENQPLSAPQQMDVLDSYMQRNEIADPTQLVTYLQGVMVDERIPLIARNHADKIIKQIQKKR